MSAAMKVQYHLRSDIKAEKVLLTEVCSIAFAEGEHNSQPYPKHAMHDFVDVINLQQQ